MATREEIEAAYSIVGPYIARPQIMKILEAAERVRANSRHEHHDHDWTHPLIREDRPE
jgi:hypothetical protein